MYYLIFLHFFHRYLSLSWTISLLKNIENNVHGNPSTKQQKKRKKEEKMLKKEPSE